MEPFLSKTVWGSAREMVISVFVCVCLIMNYGTIFEQRDRHVMSFVVSVHVCLIMNHGAIFYKL